MKAAGKSLPPWLQKAKGEGAKEAKSGKEPSKAHEKGESKRFEKAEDKGMKVGVVKGPLTKTTVVKKADGGIIDKIKSVVGMGSNSKPVIGGGLKDAIKRREERMEAVERGEPDPGQERKPKAEEEPVKKADGGKIKKVTSNATKPKSVARNNPLPKTQPLHLKNGGMVKGR